MKGGVHWGPGQCYWQECRDSHLTSPWFCPDNRIHLSLRRRLQDTLTNLSLELL